MAGSTTADTTRLPLLGDADERRKATRRLPLVDQALAEQRDLTAVERFAQYYDQTSDPLQKRYYSALVPLTRPGEGQQYAFEVDIDVCSGCKACVTACHRLNGLETNETWRAVGLLHGGTASEPVQKTVTTACHHCLDPACLTGCPVQAYEKDPETGIVKHLDDQCIGCQYCILTCPYEVPQFSKDKGIVRKCDMCSDRLAEGEAPACVQACPNEAIAIKIVNKADVLRDAEVDAFLPGTPSPGITAPTTTYKTKQAFPRNMRPGDFFAVRKAHGHMPLVVMLVLSQLSVGAFALLLGPPWLLPAAMQHNLQATQGWFALSVAVCALLSSTAHVGRPQYGFRALLGLRTSWMSREILVMGLYALAAGLYGALLAARQLPGLGALVPEAAFAFQGRVGQAVVVLGLLAVYTSVMLYHVTRRKWWHGGRVAARFYGTVAVLGCAATSLLAFGTAAVTEGFLGEDLLRFAPRAATAVSVVTLAKLLFEGSTFLHLRDKHFGDLRRSAMLLSGELRKVTVARFLLGFYGGVLVPHASLQGLSPGSVTMALAGSAMSFVALLAGELLERMTFFTAASAPRMPGGLR